MVSAVPMSRSRGSVSGFALVVLGAWGGLALSRAGPYFHSGFTPDVVWHLTTVRVYASVLPGAVVLLAGLVVLATRTRWFGGFAAVVAAAAGAWFVVGRDVMFVLNSAASNSVGDPIATSPTRQLLTQVAAFTGVGLLIVFFAALALGRQSIAAHRDHLRYGQNVYQAGTDPGAGLSDERRPWRGRNRRSESDLLPVPARRVPANRDRLGLPVQPARNLRRRRHPVPQPVPDNGDVQRRWRRALPDGLSRNLSSLHRGLRSSVFNTGPVTYSPGQTKYPPTEQTTSMTVPTEEQ